MPFNLFGWGGWILLILPIILPDFSDYVTCWTLERFPIIAALLSKMICFSVIYSSDFLFSSSFSAMGFSSPESINLPFILYRTFLFIMHFYSILYVPSVLFYPFSVDILTYITLINSPSQASNYYYPTNSCCYSYLFLI